MRTLLPLILLLALPVAAGPSTRSAQAPVERAPEMEPSEALALTSMLIGDGHWERASLALGVVEVQAEGLDLARYHTLAALLELHASDYPAAALSLQAALDAGAQDPRLYAHLAMALSSQDEPDLVGAWRALEAGAERNPASGIYGEQRVLLLVQMGLYQEARAAGAALQASGGLSPQAWVLIAESMHRGGQTAQAQIVLEQALLLNPRDPDLPLQLARLYLADGLPLAAGELLQRAAISQPALALEAAECFRQAGQLQRALMLNSQVLSPTDAARQRLGLLLELQSYERAIALGPRAQRLGLMSEDEVRYGLAYAHFMSGDLLQADRTLSGISDPLVFERATHLRQAMERCALAGGCR